MWRCFCFWYGDPRWGGCMLSTRWCPFSLMLVVPTWLSRFFAVFLSFSTLRSPFCPIGPCDVRFRGLCPFGPVDARFPFWPVWTNSTWYHPCWIPPKNDLRGGGGGGAVPKLRSQIWHCPGLALQLTESNEKWIHMVCTKINYLLDHTWDVTEKVGHCHGGGNFSFLYRKLYDLQLRRNLHPAPKRHHTATDSFRIRSIRLPEPPVCQADEPFVPNFIPIHPAVTTIPFHARRSDVDDNHAWPLYHSLGFTRIG